MAPLYFAMVASWYCREGYKAIVNKTIHVYTIYMGHHKLVGKNVINHSITAFHCMETRWPMGPVISSILSEQMINLPSDITEKNCTWSTAVWQIVTLTNFSLFIHFGWSLVSERKVS